MDAVLRNPQPSDDPYGASQVVTLQGRLGALIGGGRVAHVRAGPSLHVCRGAPPPKGQGRPEIRARVCAGACSAQAGAPRADHRGVRVSILIAAADGGATATMRCLLAIAGTVGDEIPFEVVLVDDATSDGTAAALASVQGDFRVIRNESARGVQAAWAQAAAVARGERLVLMRHDATARPGWLPALLAALEAGPVAVRARTVARGPVRGSPACVALRARTLCARSDAARAEAIERACAAAVDVPEAVVEVDGADRTPPPGRPSWKSGQLRDVGELGEFIAIRLGGRHGDILF